LAAALCALAPVFAKAQGVNPSAVMGSPLAGLAMPHTGTPQQESSWDRGGGNADMRAVEPGATLTLLDAQGAGVVRRFWVTIAPRINPEIMRQTIIRMYWDGESTPSVEVPIGDFFGVGFGQQVDYQSLPLNETSGGYNSYWPMPFHKSARWTITNLSKHRIDAFYFNIDWTQYDRLDPNIRHFHAQWRRENPTSADKNYTILEATGEGHYVGTALFMQNRRGRGLGFLEGDEMVWVDGNTKPSLYGTGTEDYFSSGWYYDRGTYSANYHGVPIKDTTLGRVSSYRWHIEDAIPFKKSIKFTIEHGHANDHEADYSSVAYWYQSEPHAAFPPLPRDPADLLAWIPPEPKKVPGAIEGESLIAGAKATRGDVSQQEMENWADEWSNAGQLWWHPAAAGDALTLTLPVKAAGTYEFVGYFTKASDYGKVQIAVNGRNIGPELNFYGAGVTNTGPVSLGRVTLPAGDVPVTITVTGKDSKSSGFLVGLDAFVLKG
jgi:hypothetical protein